MSNLILFKAWSDGSQARPNLNPYEVGLTEICGPIPVNVNLLDANPGRVEVPTFWDVQQTSKKIQFFTILIFSIIVIASASAATYCAFHYPKVALILIAPFTLSLVGCCAPTLFLKIVQTQKETLLKNIKETDTFNPSTFGFVKSWVSTDDLNSIISKDVLKISAKELDQKYGPEIASIYTKKCALEPIKNECKVFLKKLKTDIGAIPSNDKNVVGYKKLLKEIISLETFFDDMDETNYVGKINLFVQKLATLPKSELLTKPPLAHCIYDFHEFLRAYGTHTEGAGFVSVFLTDGEKQELIAIPLLTALQSPIISNACMGSFGKAGHNIHINMNLQHENARTFWVVYSKLASGNPIRLDNPGIDIEENILHTLHYASQVYQVKEVEDFCLALIKKLLHDLKQDTDQGPYLEMFSVILDYATNENHFELKKILFEDLKNQCLSLLNKLKMNMHTFNRAGKYDKLLLGLIDADGGSSWGTLKLEKFFDDMDETNYIEKINLFVQKLAALPNSHLLTEFPLYYSIQNFYQFLKTCEPHTKGAGFLRVLLKNGTQEDEITVPLLTALQSPILSKNCNEDRHIEIDLQDEDARTFWTIWSKLAVEKSLLEQTPEIRENILHALTYASEYQVKEVEDFCLSLITKMLLDFKKDKDQETYIDLRDAALLYVKETNHIRLKQILQDID